MKMENYKNKNTDLIVSTIYFLINLIIILFIQIVGLTNFLVVFLIYASTLASIIVLVYDILNSLIEAISR